MNKIEEERKIIRKINRYSHIGIRYDTNGKKLEKIREWITRIVELEAQEMGYKTKVIFDEIDDELIRKEYNGELFLRFGRSNLEEFAYFAKNTSDEFPTLRVLEIYFNENYFEYALENYKMNPIDPFIGIVETAFHELRHMRQYLMARTGISSDLSLTYAKESLITDKFEKFYTKKHRLMGYEEDAHIEGTKRWMEVYRGNRMKAKRYSAFHKISGMRIHRDDFAADMFDRLIKEEDNRYILTEYPVLQKEYNEDGTKKSADQLLENMKIEIEEILNMEGLSASEQATLIKDCKGMYFEILYREMKKKATFQDIIYLAEAYDKDDKTALFSEMKIYFKEKYEREKQNITKTGFINTNNKEKEQEQIKEIELRKNYYQAKLDFLDTLAEQQQNGEILNGIINKSKRVVRIR